MATHTETLRIRLDPELKRTIEAAATRWGMTVSAAARYMLVSYCAGRTTTKGEAHGDTTAV